MAEMHCFNASHLHAVMRQLLIAAETPHHIAECSLISPRYN
jgi:hypothetical protein